MNVASDYTYLVFIFGTLLLTLFTFALIIFLIHHKRKQQLHITEKMNLEHQYQSQLLQSRLEVQEQAFKYLSEEIHDNVGQALSMVKLQLYTLSQMAEEQQQTTLIDTTSEVLSKAINDLRNISHNLHGGYVSKKGLLEAVEKELNYIRSAKNIAARLEVLGEPYPLEGEKELLLFRIIQEAINNTTKYAQASQLHVQLDFANDYFKIIILDNGKGFDRKAPDYNSGLGLENIKNRASLLNGILDIQSKIGGGTCISLTINRKKIP